MRGRSERSPDERSDIRGLRIGDGSRMSRSLVIGCDRATHRVAVTVQGLVGSFGANAALPDASPPPKLWVASSPQSCRIPYSSSEDGIAQPIPPKFTGAGGAIRFSYCELALAGADFRSHKIDYRSTGLTRRFSRSRLAQGEQEATPAREWRR